MSYKIYFTLTSCLCQPLILCFGKLSLQVSITTSRYGLLLVFALGPFVLILENVRFKVSHMGHCIMPFFFWLVNDLVSGNCPSNSDLQWFLHLIVYLIIILFTIIYLTFIIVYYIITLWHLTFQDTQKADLRKLLKGQTRAELKQAQWTSPRRDHGKPT